MPHARPLQFLSDDELLRRLDELLRQSRRVEADLVAHIGEVDERRLYARYAVPSMFAYCTEILHLSEAEAYLRIAVARASREHPQLLDMLGDGRLHLTGIAKLAPHLTAANREALLRHATHKSKREIEELVAELAPRPDVPAVVRKVPERRSKSSPVLRLDRPQEAILPGELRLDAVTSPAGEPRPDAVVSPALLEIVQPLAPSRYKVQFTAGDALRDKLERLQALMGAEDLALVIEAAVTEKLERLEARRYGKTDAPRKVLLDSDTSSGSRHVPAAVRRVVNERDEGRCRFVDEQGRRCSERHRLEYHHRHPFGYGGDRRPQNIRLMCQAHNDYLAERDYGQKAMERYRRSGRRPMNPP